MYVTCIFVYVYMHVCTYMCIYAYMYLHIYIYIINISIHMYTHLNTFLYMSLYIHIYVYVCSQMYIRIYIYVYTGIYLFKLQQKTSLSGEKRPTRVRCLSFLQKNSSLEPEETGDFFFPSQRGWRCVFPFFSPKRDRDVFAYIRYC